MRSNVIEKLLVKILTHIREDDQCMSKPELKALVAKSDIILNRDDQRAASVSREIMNG